MNRSCSRAAWSRWPGDNAARSFISTASAWSPRPSEVAGAGSLRQYTLVPGQRDTLIALFDRYFVDGQEDAGIHVIGQFRDLDDADRFVWLRGFDSMAARGTALPRFYQGPVWQAHRDQANATMLDSDNALLLEPVYRGPALPRRDAPHLNEPTDSLIAITVACLAGPITTADLDLLDAIRDQLAGTSADLVATFTTHIAQNNFPVLPLRDEHVLAWITRFPDDAAYQRHRARLGETAQWTALLARLGARVSSLPLQHLRLRPTERSRLR